MLGKYLDGWLMLISILYSIRELENQRIQMRDDILIDILTLLPYPHCPIAHIAPTLSGSEANSHCSGSTRPAVVNQV